MHPEIGNLIEMALADGQVTDKEKEIILRKASTLGLDLDEVEMILDGKIALHAKEERAKQNSSNITNKEGDIKKCPACGSTVTSFTTNCIDCGHEFRNIRPVSSIEKLYNEFQKIEESERSRERSWTQKLDGDLGVQKSVVTRQISALGAFPVPNSKEDILEFLASAVSKSEKKPWYWGDGTTRRQFNLLADAWHRKSKQIVIKARFLMKADKKTLEDIELYAEQLKIK